MGMDKRVFGWHECGTIISHVREYGEEISGNTVLHDTMNYMNLESRKDIKH